MSMLLYRFSVVLFSAVKIFLIWVSIVQISVI